MQTESADTKDDEEAVSTLEILNTTRTLLDDQLPIQIGQEDMKIKGGSFFQW